MKNSTESSDFNHKAGRLLTHMSRKRSRLITWAQEDVNVTYAKTMYFSIFLAVGFTWNINAVIPDRIDMDTEAKETRYELYVAVIIATGIFLMVPQLKKLMRAKKRSHRPIPAHMSIVIWFLGILTVISELWMALR